jgi:hypothetical protein
MGVWRMTSACRPARSRTIAAVSSHANARALYTIVIEITDHPFEWQLVPGPLDLSHSSCTLSVFPLMKSLVLSQESLWTKHDQVLDLITGEIGWKTGPTRASRVRTLKTSVGSLREMPVSRSCGGHELES